MSKQEVKRDSLSSAKAELARLTKLRDKLKQPDEEPDEDSVEVPKKKGNFKKKIIRREDSAEEPDEEPQEEPIKKRKNKIKKFVNKEPEEEINTKTLSGAKAELARLTKLRDKLKGLDEPAVEEPQEEPIKNPKKKVHFKERIKNKIKKIVKKKPEEEPEEESDDDGLSKAKKVLARLTELRDNLEMLEQAEHLAVQELIDKDKWMLENRLQHLIKEFQSYDPPNHIYIVK